MFEAILDYVSPQKDKIGLYVQDLDSGESIAVNADRSFSSASAIKYPVMWAYYELVAKGEIDPLTVHELRDEDRVGTTPYDSGVLRELHTGIPLTYEDCVVAAEQIVLSFQGQRSYGILYAVVIQFLSFRPLIRFSLRSSIVSPASLASDSTL